MTTEEKAAAFDLVAVALTNDWSDGTWSWWCPSPPGGPHRATREEAVADLVAWAGKYKKRPLRLGAPDEQAGISGLPVIAEED